MPGDACHACMMRHDAAVGRFQELAVPATRVGVVAETHESSAKLLPATRRIQGDDEIRGQFDQAFGTILPLVELKRCGFGDTLERQAGELARALAAL